MCVKERPMNSENYVKYEISVCIFCIFYFLLYFFFLSQIWLLCILTLCGNETKPNKIWNETLEMKKVECFGIENINTDIETQNSRNRIRRKKCIEISVQKMCELRTEWFDKKWFHISKGMRIHFHFLFAPVMI